MEATEVDQSLVHRMLGHPDTIFRATCELECQLVSNGLYAGDTSAYEDPRYDRAPGRSRRNWRLLLQIELVRPGGTHDVG